MDKIDLKSELALHGSLDGVFRRENIYPNRTQITAQQTSFFNDGHLCHCNCMHFFPISFLIAFKNEGTYPAHVSKLTVDDKKLYFNMTQGNLDYVAFPFTPLKGNQMMLMTDIFTSASYPQK